MHGSLIWTSNPTENIILATVRNLSRSVFKKLQEYFFEENPENNHIYSLIKIVIEKHLRIRFHYLMYA